MTEIQQQHRNNSGGTFWGYSTALGAGLGTHALGYYGASKFADKISIPKNNSIYEKAFNTAYKNSNIGKHNIKIMKAQNLTDDAVSELAKSFTNTKTKSPFNILSQLTTKNTLFQTKEGINAVYIHKQKKILVNTEKSSCFGFHEIGHAQNDLSKWTKYISKINTGKLVPLILLTAVFKQKKKEGEKATGFFDKTTDFIKNNCGTLTFATQIPQLLDEGFASLRGLKLAKPHISADAYKNLKKFYGKNWLTYLISATAIAAGVKVSSIISDKMSKS